MDFYIKLLLTLSVPTVVLVAWTVARLLRLRKNLNSVVHVTIPASAMHDVVLKTCQEYAIELDVESALAHLAEQLKGIVSVTSISFLIPSSPNSTDYIFKSHLLYEVSEAFVTSDLSALRDFSEHKLDVSIHNVDKRIEGGPLNSASTAKPLSRVIYALDLGEFKGAICLTSRKRGHFSDIIKKDLERLFSLCSTYFELLTSVASKEHRKFQSMVDSMRDGVFMVDANFRFLIANPALKELLGLHVSETVNIVRVSTFFASELSVEDVISEVFALGSLKTVDDIVLGDKHYRLTAIPVKSAGAVESVVCILQDETSEKELDRMKRDFSAMIIHELRSPLSVIRGTSDFLLKESANIDNSQKEAFLTQIKTSSDRLLKLVNDLLDSAKIESGNIELHKSEVSLNDIVTDAVSYYMQSAKQRHLTLATKLDPDLPLLNADKDKLWQVVGNLISNALKYTDEGGSIELRTSHDADNVRLVVADTGKGVDDAYKKIIFEKYKQAELSKTSGEKSTGLGLAICKGIVEAHGGRIWVEDNTPKGALFIVELPLK